MSFKTTTNNTAMVNVSELIKIINICQDVATNGVDADDLSIVLKELHDKFEELDVKFIEYFDCNASENGIYFLALAQIATCLKVLYKTSNVENATNVILSTNRRYFFDRILWCFQEIRSSLESTSDKAKESFIEDNFLNCFDGIFELLDEVVKAVSQESFNSLTDRIQVLVGFLFCRVLAIANATYISEMALVTLCGNIFENLKDLQTKRVTESGVQIRSLMELMTENLIQMEFILKETIILSIPDLSSDYQIYTLDALRKTIKYGRVDGEEFLEQFRKSAYKTVHIGLYAIASTTKTNLQLQIKSALASLESLNDLMIPTFESNTLIFDSQILCRHYEEEIISFETAVKQVMHEMSEDSACEEMDDFVELAMDTQAVYDYLKLWDIVPSFANCVLYSESFKATRIEPIKVFPRTKRRFRTLKDQRISLFKKNIQIKEKQMYANILKLGAGD